MSNQPPALLMAAAVMAVAALGTAQRPLDGLAGDRQDSPTATPGVIVRADRDLSRLPVQSSTRVVVRFEGHVDTRPLDRMLRPLGARLVEVGYGDAFHVLEVPEGTSGAWVDLFSHSDAVLYAEPEGIVHAFGTPPNDPFWQYQWHMMDQGAISGAAASNFGVQAPEAWNTTTGTGAIVAVVDTGVAYENFGSFQVAPDLASTSFVAGYDFINNDAHANDDEGHGTHVAGTIAQSTNNGLGCAGVAYGATIMPVKVLSSTGSGSTTAVANGIRFAADNGAHVINLSLGSSVGATALLDAVNYAASLGVVICAATGNSGASSIGFPASYSACIAVGASRFDGNRAPYSQYGTGIDVTAPGGDTSVDQNGDGYVDGVLQQTFGATPTSFGYYFYQGTSMATPHVAGIAALCRAANPTATAAAIRTAIESTCRDRGTAGYDTVFGYGIVDAAGAVAAIGGGGGSNPPPAAPTGLGAVAGNASVALDWANNAESDLAGYHVYRSTTSGSGYARITASLLGASAYTDNGVSNGTTYYYVVTAVDTAGNESATSGQASATPSGSDTTPPAAPTGITTSRGTTSIGLDWSDNAEADLAGYHVYRSTTSTGTFTRINGSLLTASAYTDSSVVRRVRYYYVVTAVDTTGNESAPSVVVSQRTR